MNSLSLDCDVSFIDIGFNKTAISFFNKNRIVSLVTLAIGGNHITKDISEILKIDLKNAEKIKCNFDKNPNIFDNNDYSIDLLKKIIFARIEEILEICAKSVRLNLSIKDKSKMILMGDGSKILDNKYKDKISFSNDLDLLEETTQDICRLGFKMGVALNEHELAILPKKQIKQGFFEKLFHFLR